MTDATAFFDTLVRLEIELWNEIDARLHDADGVTLARYQALRAVHEHDGRARVHEVAEDLGITVGAASKLVDRLERDGTRRAAARTRTTGAPRSSRSRPTGYGDAAPRASVAARRRRAAARTCAATSRRHRRLDDASPAPRQLARHGGAGDRGHDARGRRRAPGRARGPAGARRARPARRTGSGPRPRARRSGSTAPSCTSGRGQASSGQFPRIPGIEAAGVVEAAPGGEFAPGTQVVTLMGGMGRDVRRRLRASTSPCRPAQVIPFAQRPAVGRARRGARDAADRRTARSPSASGRPPGRALLIRGGTSSVGMALAVLAQAAAA